VEHEELDQFEQELRQALERRPAPPGLKGRVMERRSARMERRSWFARSFFGSKSAGSAGRAHSLLWMRVAATVLLAAAVGWGLHWRVEKREEQRRGEEARQQVMTALRITGHALNQVHVRLAAHDRGE